MPNWVINEIRVAGDPKQVEELFDTFCDIEQPDGSHLGVDFNAIDPMPADLYVVEGTWTSAAVALYRRDVLDAQLDGREVELLDSMTDEQLYERTYPLRCEDSIEVPLLEAGKVYYDNLQNYGATTWYPWAIEHWGTKWNASMAYAERGEKYISFETAWATPTKLYETLTGRFPDITLHIDYADEDLGSNCGHIEASRGRCAFDCPEPGSREALEFSCEVWGFEVEEYLEDFVEPGIKQ